ncbi:hypothetical protein AAG570_010006 [Ranatra chinensis]|uniref:U6 small nuclear RNA (adenine-(43)-N(6))-methyltransferase n=1 Tax=Ranatra chinensis TaxID=642074 RepID=A0ABD0YLA7_9HEMI
MALNKFMHPKNPYRTPPDFKQLAIKYPEFRKHVQQDLSGKVHLDFKDEGSVKALTNALLDKDFSLMVELPDDRLVPTLPLRLNYLLWIEDLLIFCGLADKKVMGIDIGTGASCIYPLLAARKFDWSMLATEIDKQSVRVAQSNVNRNSLSDKIKVEHVDVGSILVGVVDEGKVYDFSMCNPPFFSDRCEVGRGNNAPSGLEHELVAQGGEIAFITKIIADSAQLGQSVRLYTTMIGHKSHVSSVKREVRAAGARSMVSTELCQGRTIRWVVAWTFMPDIDLSSMDKTCGLPKNQPHDKRPPLIYNFTLAQPSSLDAIKNKVQDALTKLEVYKFSSNTSLWR